MAAALGDTRDELPVPRLRSDVMSLGGLEARHGADGHRAQRDRLRAFRGHLGVHQDGLVHISQLSDKFIKHPARR